MTRAGRNVTGDRKMIVKHASGIFECNMGNHQNSLVSKKCSLMLLGLHKNSLRGDGAARAHDFGRASIPISLQLEGTDALFSLVDSRKEHQFTSVLLHVNERIAESCTALQGPF